MGVLGVDQSLNEIKRIKQHLRSPNNSSEIIHFFRLSQIGFIF